MPNGLYAVIATVDGQETTTELLRALATDMRFRIIVIDNGSTPEFRQWLYSLQTDGIVILCNEHNTGVAAAWNQGIRIAMQNAARGVLIAGNDTCPMPGTLDRILSLAGAGCPFVTGTQVPWETTPVQVPAPTLADKVILAPDFSFFFLPALTVEVLARFEAQNGAHISPWSLGIFDERFYPAYFEDNDFHTRLHRAGLVAVRDPQALYRHRCSQTMATHPELAQQQQLIMQRNADLFRQKWSRLPHELDVPPHARPLNVTDAQWAEMTAGRPVIEVDRAVVTAQAQQVYAKYGIPATPPPPPLPPTTVHPPITEHGPVA